MARVELEGEELIESCEPYEDAKEWLVNCYDTEFDIDVKDIDFDEDEIEEIIESNADKVAELLANDKKFFDEVMKKVERIRKRREKVEEKYGNGKTLTREL